MSAGEEIEQVTARDGVLDGVVAALCPFCGEGDDLRGLVDIIRIEGPDGIEDQSAVACAACGAMGPGSPDGIAGAVRAWNRRRRL
jgi:hypothetical protein